MAYTVMLLFFMLLCSTTLISNVKGDSSYDVKNVHIAIVKASTSMAVSWLTTGKTNSSIVKYGTSSMKYTMNARGVMKNYDFLAGYNHDVVLDGLKPAATYYYICGSSEGWSKEFSFNTSAATPEGFTALVYGDLGYSNAKNTIERVVDYGINGDVDFVLHCGDISYANDHPWEYETVWQSWFQDMEPLMARIPYMVAVGNHESWCRNPICMFQTAGFTAYKYKFRMPGTESKSNSELYYSFDYGLAHIIAINTEGDFPGHPFIDPKRRRDMTDEIYEETGYAQADWLVADLRKAVANRHRVPWIIIFGHRPVYSTVWQDKGIPVGQAKKLQMWLEPLLLKYQVDIVALGHVHHYERMVPVLNNIPLSNATQYLVVGGAGNAEGIDKFGKDLPIWHASGNDHQYGYGKLKIIDEKNALWTYHRSDTNAITDSLSFKRPWTFSEGN